MMCAREKTHSDERRHGVRVSKQLLSPNEALVYAAGNKHKTTSSDTDTSFLAH